MKEFITLGICAESKWRRIIRKDEVMDAQSLPKVKMPNLDHFALASGMEARDTKASGLPLIPGQSGTRGAIGRAFLMNCLID
jgi:hypothetical protein